MENAWGEWFLGRWYVHLGAQNKSDCSMIEGLGNECSIGSACRQQFAFLAIPKRNQPIIILISKHRNTPGLTGLSDMS